MDAVLGHGFHPLKARQRRSIPNLQTVHRHGRIQAAGQIDGISRIDGAPEELLKKYQGLAFDTARQCPTV
jgi:hypothetical protein